MDKIIEKEGKNGIEESCELTIMLSFWWLQCPGQPSLSHQLGAGNEFKEKVLHKWQLAFCLGKSHQQKVRYSPSCLRLSARTSETGAEVWNRGPGCDTCCSRTPRTSAHDTGFEHRSPTLA